MMDILKTSSWAAGVATVVASGMILLMGNTVADNEMASQPNIANIVPSQSLSRPSKAMPETSIGAKIFDKIVLEKVSHNSMAPPPGPFVDKNTLKINLLNTMPIAPLAPLQPTTKVVAPINYKNTQILNAAPAQPKINAELKLGSEQPTMPSAPIMPTSNNSEGSLALNNSAPVLSKKIGAAPSLPIEEKAIWMQTNDNFNNPSVQNQMTPNRNTSLNWNGWQSMQMPNANRIYPQHYMYVPVPMAPQNISMPQVPNYWMRTPTDGTNVPALNKRIIIK